MPGLSRADGLTNKSRYRELSDVALLEAVKREESGAILEVINRFHPVLLRYSAKLRIDEHERHNWTVELIHDVVLTLVRPDAILPRSLGAYFVRAARNKAYSVHRAATRREKYEVQGPLAEGASAPDYLELQQDAADGSINGTELPPGVRRLIAHLENTLSREERELLDWSVEGVPLRIIADWTNVTRTTAAHRISRLRQRLIRLSLETLLEFSDSERSDVEQLMLRCGTKP